jgi:hypothetical protein
MANKTLRFQTSNPAFYYGGVAYVRINGGPVNKVKFDGINWDVEAEDGDEIECWFKTNDADKVEREKSRTIRVVVGERLRISPPIYIGEV